MARVRRRSPIRDRGVHQARRLKQRDVRRLHEQRTDSRKQGETVAPQRLVVVHHLDRVEEAVDVVAQRREARERAGVLAGVEHYAYPRLDSIEHGGEAALRVLRRFAHVYDFVFCVGHAGEGSLRARTKRGIIGLVRDVDPALLRLAQDVADALVGRGQARRLGQGPERLDGTHPHREVERFRRLLRQHRVEDVGRDRPIREVGAQPVDHEAAHFRRGVRRRRDDRSRHVAEAPSRASSGGSRGWLRVALEGASILAQVESGRPRFMICAAPEAARRSANGSLSPVGTDRGPRSGDGIELVAIATGAAGAVPGCRLGEAGM